MKVKKIKFAIPVFILALSIYSCSSDSADEPITIIETPQVETATIDSYSKDFGYSDESISIYGTNLSTKIENISIKFDNTQAIVESATLSEIVVKLPNASSSVPKLNISIPYRTIINKVENNYNGNIGILASSANEWHSITSTISGGRKLLITGKDRAYISKKDNGGGGNVYRTVDGGLTWQHWAPVGFYQSYYPTTNDDGWSDFAGLNKVPTGGSQMINFIFSQNFSIVGMHVNDDLLNGTIITPEKVVYKTTNGKDFIEVYNNSNGNLELQGGYFSLNNNQIWQGGRSTISDKLTLFFLTNTADEWQEIELSIDGNNTNVNKIQFIDNLRGFINVFSPTTGIKLCKTIDGGNTWTIINEVVDSNYSTFCFKNENIGWVTSENKIYKTIDGGVNWSLDYTNNSAIFNISYKDGVVYAMADENILKYFAE